MKKKVLSIVLAISMSAALFACGSSSGSDTAAKTEEKKEETAKTEDKAAEEKKEEAPKKEEPKKEEAKDAPTEGYNEYDKLIAEVAHQIEDNWKDKQPADLKVSAVFTMAPADSIGYSKTDVNSDGVKELLFGESPEGADTTIYDIYTIVDNKMVQLADGSDRNRYYLVQDHDGLIANEGSNGADDSSTKYYTIEKGALKDAAAPDGQVKYAHVDFTSFNTNSGDSKADEKTDNKPDSKADDKADSNADYKTVTDWKECKLADIKAKLGDSFRIPEEGEKGPDLFCQWSDSMNMAEVIYHIDDKDFTQRAIKATEFKEITELMYSNPSSEEKDKICGKYDSIERRFDEGHTYYDSIQWYDSDAGLMYSITAMSSDAFEGFDITAYASQISSK